MKTTRNPCSTAYICSPYRGNSLDERKQNVELAKKLCRLAALDGYIPIAPHLLYPQFLDEDNEVERHIGLKCATGLLEQGVIWELWVYCPTPEQIDDLQSHLHNKTTVNFLSEGMIEEINTAFVEQINIYGISLNKFGELERHLAYQP